MTSDVATRTPGSRSDNVDGRRGRAALRGLHRLSDGAMRRHQHHRRPDLLLAQCGDQLDAGELAFAQHDVRHHRLDVAQIGVVQSAFDAGMGEAVPAKCLKSPGQDGAGIGLVLDQQDDAGRGAGEGIGAVRNHLRQYISPHAA